MQAYLLAAGRGRRAGGPKAWIECEGRPLLERQLEFLIARIPAARIAVSIQKEWLPRCEEISRDVRWVPCDPDAKPLASLQTLLRASPMRGWASLHHVDMPVWDARLWDALEAATSGGAEAVIPCYGGRRGHPVLLAPTLAVPMLALLPDLHRLDWWLRKRNVLEVAVDCAGSVENWNEGPVPA